MRVGPDVPARGVARQPEQQHIRPRLRDRRKLEGSGRQAMMADGYHSDGPLLRPPRAISAVLRDRRDPLRWLPGRPY
jgi:hypothetical protein